MGSDKHYPEERPVHRVTVDGFWMDRYPGHQRAFRAVRRGDRTRHVRRGPAQSRRLSRRAAGHALRRIAGLRPAGRTGRSPRHQPLVAVRARRRLAPSDGRRQLDRRPERHPVVHVTFGDAEAFARGKARRCRPKRNGSSRRAVDWRARRTPGATSSCRAIGTWRTPGRASFPGRTSADDGYERTSPVGAFPPNGYGCTT